jgi:hypothetical protein
MTEALSHFGDDEPLRPQVLPVPPRQPSPLYQHLEAYYGPLDTSNPGDQPRIAVATHSFLADRIRSVYAERHPEKPARAPVVPFHMVEKSLGDYYDKFPAERLYDRTAGRAVVSRRQQYLDTYTEKAHEHERSFPEIHLAAKLSDELATEESVIAANAIRELIAGYGNVLSQLNRKDNLQFHYGL